MADQNDFFTWQSLLTFAGTTTATTAVTNGLARAWSKFKAGPTGLVVALILCLATALVDMNSGPNQGSIVWARPFATYFIAIVNGFFVFSSAAGLSAGAASLSGIAPTTDRKLKFPQPTKPFWRYWL